MLMSDARTWNFYGPALHAPTTSATVILFQDSHLPSPPALSRPLSLSLDLSPRFYALGHTTPQPHNSPSFSSSSYLLRSESGSDGRARTVLMGKGEVGPMRKFYSDVLTTMEDPYDRLPSNVAQWKIAIQAILPNGRSPMVQFSACLVVMQEYVADAGLVRRTAFAPLNAIHIPFERAMQVTSVARGLHSEEGTCHDFKLGEDEDN
ncbi:hypothetical protein ACLOJK_013568 [Asimina triloba]